MEPTNRLLLNYFATASIDRMAERRKDDTWLAEQLESPHTRVVPVWRDQNLIDRTFESLGKMKDEERCCGVFPTVPEFRERIPGVMPGILLGKDIEDGTVYFAADLSGDEKINDISGRFSGVGAFTDLVRVGARINRNHGALLAYARAISFWHRSHRFCGTCGSPTSCGLGGHLLVCSREDCKKQHFPRMDPAVIVLVSNGEKCLLGRHARWREGLYSTIAGFVEPGETLELAVAREVEEETGVRVDPARVTYHSSQPWPFPCSLMLGFTAHAEIQEIRLDTEELEDARWFTADEIREAKAGGIYQLSSRFSIAYRLIDDWVKSVSH